MRNLMQVSSFSHFLVLFLQRPSNPPRRPPGISQLMLPYPEYSPACFAKAFCNRSVALLIPENLRNPIAAVGTRPSAMKGATVPETPVNKHCKSLTTKSKIRFARQRQVSAPPLDAVGAQDGGELNFRGLITARAYCRHQLRPVPFF